MQTKRPPKVAGICIFLAAAVFAVFGRTTIFGFVNFDDDLYVFNNPVVAHGLTSKGIVWEFTHADCFLYHPLTMISLMADSQFHGPGPGSYHLTNVILHAATAVLLFLVLRQMTGSLWRSAFVAAVVALHPMRVESVAWISERKDVLGTFFFILTLGAYSRYALKPKSLLRYMAVALAFILALLSKPTAVTLPFVLLLLDYWPLKRIDFSEPGGWGEKRAALKRLILEKLPLLVLSAGGCVMTMIAAGREITAHGDVSMLSRVGNGLISYVVYLRQTAWPEGLAVLYPYPAKGYPIWETVLAVLLLAAISWAAWAFGRRQPWFLVGWAWYLGILFPMIGIVKVGSFAHADRYTYLPQIGLAIALTWIVADLTASLKNRRWLWGVLAVGAIGAFAVCAFIQTSYWKDGETLWTRALACTSDNVVAHLNLGEVFRNQDRLDQTIGQYREALEIEPANVKILNNLANVLAQKGADAEALAQYEKALKIQPGYGETHINLGNLFMHGRLDDAVAEYNKALKIDPHNADVLNNLGKALALKGDDNGAVAQYEKALQTRPDYANVHFNLANRLLKLGKLDEAAAHYRKVLELSPTDAGARNNLGRVLLLKGEPGEAMECFGKTTRLTPDAFANWRGLGDGFLDQKYFDEAIQCYRQALKINPQSSAIVHSLADAYAGLYHTNSSPARHK